MLHTNISSGGSPVMPPPRCTQSHVNLEAVVALYCILGDVSAGTQVNLAIQLICLQQEDNGPYTPVTPPHPLMPLPGAPSNWCLTSSAVESL